MVATAVYSVTMVLWKETAFPLCRAIERRWKSNVVSRVSSVIVVIRLPVPVSLCELDGHLMPCTSCFYGKWVEDVCAGQYGVFVYLVIMQRLTRRVSVIRMTNRRRDTSATYFTFDTCVGWLGSRVVSVLDSGAEGLGSNCSCDAVG